MSRLVDLLEDGQAVDSTSVYRIQSVLAKAGMYGGPVDGEGNVELEAAVQSLMASAGASGETSAAQREQIRAMGAESQMLQKKLDEASEGFRMLVSALYTPEQASAVLAQLGY